MDVFEAINRADATSLILSTGQKPESKKDLLVVGELPRSDFHELLIDVSANVDAFISDDAVILPDERCRIGVAYYDTESFVKTTHQIADGNLIDPIGKHWSAGPWLPEAFASDINRSVEVKAGTSIDKTTANIFSSYPEGLRMAIISRSQAEIALKSAMITSEIDGLVKKFAETELCLAALRYIYAQHKVYFRGIKYEPQARLELPGDAAEISAKIISSGDCRGIGIDSLTLGL